MTDIQNKGKVVFKKNVDTKFLCLIFLVIGLFFFLVLMLKPRFCYYLLVVKFQFLVFIIIIIIFFWTLNVSQTASYEITLVHLSICSPVYPSVRPSLNFL